MTQKQKEHYLTRYVLDMWKCQRCFRPAQQQAHRISQSKMNYKKYGKDIIDHNMNIVSSCSECNDYFNIGMNPGKCEKLVAFIKAHKDEYIESETITGIINE